MDATFSLVVGIGIFAILLIAGRIMNVVSDRGTAWYVCLWVALFVVGRVVGIPEWGWLTLYLPLYAILLVHVNGEDSWSARIDFFGLTQWSKNNLRKRL